ncbi:MAG: hypothetical protein A2550_03625 [Candidatus Jacksonbacteria bacterium RIFOXYD2_FULL_43_21]|nr:MAG: hypothetical protein A2240_01330 [Candidatus Jacksonbacteria bacterium RIFOXYA2_FULL_43_12]OGY81831.1 MAG: hypothetical protein A2550_03625 [Candidatus Jacksonbacteria bacterium RIFOXYD2_FULL_43_21]
MRIATLDATGLYYNSPDHLTSASVITNTSGTVVQKLDYYPFGSERVNEKVGAFQTHFTFTDQEKDDESGLMYYGARYYDPVIGRFTSVDPVVADTGRKEFVQALANPQLLNGYSYVGNNPLKYVDPNGENELIFAALFGGLVVLAAYAPAIQNALPMIPAMLDNPAMAGEAALSLSPGTGDAIDAYELTTGKSFWTGENIGTFGRFMTALGTAAPLIPARWFRQAGDQLASYLRRSQRVEWMEYTRHLSPNNIPWKNIVEGTTSGVAKYRPGLNVEALERYVWEKGTQVTNGRNWKVMEFDETIGASAGKEVQWVRVEESAGGIHGHPITKEDYNKLTK